MYDAYCELGLVLGGCFEYNDLLDTDPLAVAQALDAYADQLEHPMTTQPAVELTVERVREWLQSKKPREVVDDRARPRDGCGWCVLETYLREHGVPSPSVLPWRWSVPGECRREMPQVLRPFIARVDLRNTGHNITAATALRILNSVAPPESEGQP